MRLCDVAAKFALARQALGRRGSLLALGALGCLGGCVVPAMSASGALVSSIVIEEHYALSNDVLEVSFQGKSLQRVVDLFDKHQLFGLRGRYRASGVVNTSRLVLRIRDGSEEKKVVLENCREPRFCAFADEAFEEGIVRKRFASCRNENACVRDMGE